MAEQQLAEAKKKVTVGTLAPAGALAYERALLRARRQLAAIEEPPGGPQQRELLQKEIQIQEQW